MIPKLSGYKSILLVQSTDNTEKLDLQGKGVRSALNMKYSFKERERTDKWSKV